MKNDVMKFLLGEGPLDGVWFGDKHPTEKGAFWWRKHLRQFITQNQPNSGNTVLCGEGHNEAVIINGDNTITNDQSQTTTLTAPNGLLPAEGLAKSVRGGVVFMCENCMAPLPFLRKGNLCHNCA